MSARQGRGRNRTRHCRLQKRQGMEKRKQAERLT